MPATKRWTKRREELLQVPATDECVIHRGRIAPNGYGTIGKEYAHRLAYEKHVGPVPEGSELDHQCRTRSCINWRHLEPVSHSENALRGLTGSHPKLLTRKLTTEQVVEIRASQLPNRTLATIHGVSRETIRTARKLTHYREVS